MPFTEEQVQTILKRYIESNDAVGVVNRGHQFILSGMKELITSYGAPSHRPEKIRRLNFSGALTVVDCLGLITADEYNLLEQVNKLRNAIEHQDHEPVPEDEAKLFLIWTKTLGRKGGKPVEYVPDEFPGLFGLLLMLTYNILSHRAADFAKDKLANKADALEEGAHALPMVEGMWQHAVVKNDENAPHYKLVVEMLRLLKAARAENAESG